MIPSANITQENLPGMDTDASGKSERLERLIELSHCFGDTQGSLAGLFPQGSLRSRSLPYRQDRISFQVDNEATVLLYRLECGLKIFMHVITQFSRTHRLRQVGVPRGIREQTSPVYRLAASLHIN